MNILIIGNGFDLAHKLPTQYPAFLKFINVLNGFERFMGTVSQFISPNGKYKFSEFDIDVQNYIIEAIKDDSNRNKEVSSIWKNKKSLDDKSNRIKYIEEMILLSKNNSWFKWFQEQHNINPDWIDFEAEISRVVQEFEKMISFPPLEIPQMTDIQKSINKCFFKGNATNKTLKSQGIQEYKENMLKDLNELIRCFEIYLEDCVGNIDKKMLSPDIYDLRIDKLLSFNYTGTYERIYSCKNRNVDFDYIHGKSNILSEKDNNMVLGIDEYLEGEERLKNTDFIEFKKYYQRLKKKTGCIYKKWIEKINNSKKNTIHNVYIFGHSLAMTDSDILTEFITNKKTKITIFYYYDSQYSAQIINLVHMLGPDKLNEMVYGSNPKIEFKRQSEMIDITLSEWEVLNDRHQLWNIYNMNDKQITRLIQKIKKKVKAFDTTYFHDQANVISIYNALVTNCDSDFNLYDDFIELARLLCSGTIFDSESWAIPDYRGNLFCDRRTKKFIDAVNTLNCAYKAEKYNEFSVDNLETLYDELNSNPISKEKGIELFEDLFGMFKSEDCDCSTIWKCIYKLYDKCTEMDWKSFIKSKVENAELIDKIRLDRLLDAIHEQEYYDEMAKEQEAYENEYE